MAQAIWNDTVIAESNDTKRIEGNLYFPPNSIKKEYFRKSKITSVCHWKGTASYYDIEVGGLVNTASAWYYPEPKSAAADLKDHVAFWRGVTVQE